jgi:hypothetical protein
MLRCIRPLPNIRGMVPGPHLASVVVGHGMGPCCGPCPLPEAEFALPGSGEAESSPGGRASQSLQPRVGRGGTRAPEVRRGRAHAPGVGRGGTLAPGLDEAEPALWGSDEAAVMSLLWVP